MLLVLGAVLFSVPALHANSVFTVDRGKSPSGEWSVIVAPDGKRKGICLQAVVLNYKGKSGGVANGSCSAPAKRRGLVRSVVIRSKDGAPALTVVGAAFNRAVARVEVIRLDGNARSLQLRPGPAVHDQVANFNYLGFASSGSWCIKELITRSKNGSVLWSVGASELLPYDPGRFCG